jgi:TonB family protein
MRGPCAAVVGAIFCAGLCLLFATRSAVASGNPQSGQSGSYCAVELGRDSNLPSSTFATAPTEATSSSPRTVISTRENLQLTVRADCGNVEVFTDAANEVSYRLRLNAKLAGADANELLRNFSLTAESTPQGVVLVQHAASRNACRFNATHEIHVPRRYKLNIALRFGDIFTQDIDGSITLVTGGGNIRAGRVASDDGARGATANARFQARLETGGGDISIGDVAGGLSAGTAGGKILVGDVHGQAVLRTGGGDIHAGHVFGSARLVSGGGDITVEKADGGLWADTAGGRLEIGNRVATIGPRGHTAQRDAFPSEVPDVAYDAEQEMATTAGLEDRAEFGRLLDVFLWGALRVDPAYQQKRLVRSIAPEYPEVARLAEIQGDVTLRIFVGRDGSIRDLVALSGHPVLARAAMHAVEQWRYAPAVVDGRPVDVVTTVTLAFRLQP